VKLRMLGFASKRGGAEGVRVRKIAARGEEIRKDGSRAFERREDGGLYSRKAATGALLDQATLNPRRQFPMIRYLGTVGRFRWCKSNG
jgi:hypothetical protein